MLYVAGLDPSLKIFSSDDSPETLSLSQTPCAVSIMPVTIACASDFVLETPDIFDIH